MKNNSQLSVLSSSSSLPTNRASPNIAVAPPSGAALTRHDSENRKDESQLYLIVSHVESSDY